MLVITFDESDGPQSRRQRLLRRGPRPELAAAGHHRPGRRPDRRPGDLARGRGRTPGAPRRTTTTRCSPRIEDIFGAARPRLRRRRRARTGSASTSTTAAGTTSPAAAPPPAPPGWAGRVSALLGVGQRHRAQPGVDAQPAQRLGLPARRAVARPRAAGSGRCRGPAPGRRSVRPARLVVRDAVADVAAGPAPARCARSSPTEAPQSRGMPERAAPGVGEPACPRAPGSSSTQRARAASAKTRGVAVVRRAGSREPKWYGAPRPPNDQPVVGGALAVDDQVPVVGERLAARASPICVPDRRGQRLGGDHQRVDRRDARAAGPRSAGGVALGGAHARPRRARRRASVLDPAGLDRRDRGCARRSCTPRRSTAAARPAHEPRRVDRGAVRGVRRRRGRPVAVEHRGAPRRRRAAVRRPRRGPRRGPSRPRRAPGASCGRRAGQRDRAALWRSGRRCPRRRRPGRPRRRCRASPGAGPARAVAAGRRGQRRASEAGNSAEHQPPLRPGRAEAGDLGLEHRDPQVGSASAQVVGGPEPGEPGADDGDVDVAVAGQRRAAASSRRRRSRATARAAQSGRRRQGSAHAPRVGLLAQLEVHERLGGHDARDGPDPGSESSSSRCSSLSQTTSTSRS